MKDVLHRFFESVTSSIPDLVFEVQFWDGERVQYGTGNAAFLLILHTERAARRILAAGALGFGEEYAAGNIDTEGDFSQLMRLGTTPQIGEPNPPLGTKLSTALRRLLSANTRARAPKNIASHYSRGNELYQMYLDKSMTYSCAYFHSPDDSLEQAQRQKHEHVCRKLQLKAGETLVDIGCGWGGMLMYAASEHGAQATGCTLSVPQVEYALQQVKTAQLESRVTVLLKDYREMAGAFDKFVSIGMFEHVGKRYIPVFMKKVRKLLKPEGIGLLHTIGKERDGHTDPWTMKYIFPGGYIPTLHETLEAMGRAGLVALDVENLRLHYALTLDEWARRFERNVDRIREMFGEQFVRTWRMFLQGSAAGFRWGNSRLYQITFTHGVNNSLPLTRSHVYA